jgi:hypothetical protein
MAAFSTNREGSLFFYKKRGCLLYRSQVFLKFFSRRIATARVADLGEARQFKRGREVSAFLGLTLRQHSSGGKERLAAVCTTRSTIAGIPSGRCLPFGFGIQTRLTACGSYSFALILRQFPQPPFFPVCFNVLEPNAIYPRCPLVGFAVSVGVFQYVRPVHLVIQQVESIPGFSLRFGMERLL